MRVELSQCSSAHSRGAGSTSAFVECVEEGETMSNKVSLPGKTPVGLADGLPSALIALAGLRIKAKSTLSAPLIAGSLMPWYVRSE